MGGTSELIEEIERDAEDGGVPLKDALAKCIQLALRMGDSDLRRWAMRELRGYRPSDDVPKWRTVPGRLMADVSDGFRGDGVELEIRPEHLPESYWSLLTPDVPLRLKAEDLEACASGSPVFDVKLEHPESSEIMELWERDRYFSSRPAAYSFYWSVPKQAIRGVVESLRTQLVERMSDLRLVVAHLEESVPASTKVESVAERGSRSRSPVAAAWVQAIRVTWELCRGKLRLVYGWPNWAKVGAFVAGLATVVGVILQATGR